MAREEYVKVLEGMKIWLCSWKASAGLCYARIQCFENNEDVISAATITVHKYISAGVEAQLTSHEGKAIWLQAWLEDCLNFDLQQKFSIYRIAVTYHFRTVWIDRAIAHVKSSNKPIPALITPEEVQTYVEQL